MQQQENHDVAVFWDFDNYCPASNVSGYEVVDNIRCVAHTFGTVKLFKAYQASPLTSSPQLSNLRSELQASGVSLIDCPCNGRKDAAEKILIVDMMAHAIDNPAPSTIILISGDRDFAYAVSILRFRRYRVVIISPTGAHPSLTAQASVHLDWNIEVMGQVNHDAGPPSTDPNPTKPRPPRTLSCRRADSTTRRQSTSRSWYMRDADRTDGDICSDYDPPARINHNTPQVNGYGHESPSPTYPQTTSLLPERRAPSPFPETPSKVHSPPATYQSVKAPPPTPPAAHKTLEPVLLNGGHFVHDSRTATTLQKGFPFSEPESASQPFPNALDFLPATGTASSGVSQQPDAQPLVVQISPERAQSPIHPAVTPAEEASIPPQISMTSAEVSPLDSTPVPAAPQVITSDIPPAKQGSPVPPTPVLTKPAPVASTPSTPKYQGNQSPRLVPAPFVTLVDVLKARRSQGINTTSRAELGSILIKEKTLYKRAGVTSFAAYISLAVNQDIVGVGGSGNSAYVSLRPEWYGASTVS